MLIAIDYDDTYTDDPEFWRGVIALGQERGHRFVIVAAREERHRTREEIEYFLYKSGVRPSLLLFLTEGNSKRQFLRDCGTSPDVWIDDLPESVGMSTLAALNQVHRKGITLREPNQTVRIEGRDEPD